MWNVGSHNCVSPLILIPLFIFPPDMMHASTVAPSILTTTNESKNVTCEISYEDDRVPLMVLYIVVFIIGLPANLATVYLTLHQVCRKNVLGIYLLSLSVCDLTYLFTLPLWTVYVNQNHVWPWSSLACKVTGFVFFNNMYISIFLLCCVSIDRYVAVVYAIESRGLRQKRIAALVAFSIYMVVGLGHTPVFIMSEGNAAQGKRRCFEPSQSSAIVTGFSYARVCIGFFIPLAILIFTNRAILANVQPVLASSLIRKRRCATWLWLWWRCFWSVSLRTTLSCCCAPSPSTSPSCKRIVTLNSTSTRPTKSP